jgi:hypothetical protein
MTRVFACPEEALAGEIEFGLAYAMACNPGRAGFAPGDRKLFAAAAAAVLAERAEHGLSGMSIEDSAGAEVTSSLNRA